jgi:hypothetical protein
MMGSADPIVPPLNGRLLTTLIPRARLVESADGHLFLLTSAAESAAIVHKSLPNQSGRAIASTIWPAPNQFSPATCCAGQCPQ